MALSCKEEDPNAQINAEVQAINEYLDSDGPWPTLYDQSGMRMVVRIIGDQPSPHTGQTVKFDYHLKLLSTGTTVESGTMNDKLENMPTEGLRYSLTAMMGGSIGTFYIPSKYGYGEAGKTGVPPNSTLVYEILSRIEVTRTSAELTQFKTDTAAIRQYIINPSNNIKNAVKLTSGVWYTLDAPGTGRITTPYDNVSFGFKGTVMSNAFVFQENAVTDQSVFGLIEGLKVGLPNIQEGSTATFYIPSGLGYGTVGATNIPANANISFRIQLNSVKPYFE